MLIFKDRSLYIIIYNANFQIRQRVDHTVIVQVVGCSSGMLEVIVSEQTVWKLKHCSTLKKDGGWFQLQKYVGLCNQGTCHTTYVTGKLVTDIMWSWNLGKQCSSWYRKFKGCNFKTRSSCSLLV